MAKEILHFPAEYLFITRRDLKHAVNLRHGTGVFTSPPKEFCFGF
jgi:hypothetical protein